jgi:hypothetical protein
MGTKKSRRWFWPHLLAGAAIGAALALPAPLASADEVGESFWTPGSFGSLAATPAQPGFSLSSGYYRINDGRQRGRARPLDPDRPAFRHGRGKRERDLDLT